MGFNFGGFTGGGVGGGDGDIRDFAGDRASLFKEDPNAALLREEPRRLLDEFRRISEEGVLGEGGVAKISNAQQRAADFKRKRLAHGIRRRLGRRIGSRSGAVEQLVANKVQAPGIVAQSQNIGDLIRRNMESKTTGLRGQASVLDLIRQIEADRQAAEAANDDGGLLGGIGGIIELGTDIYRTMQGDPTPAIKRIQH